MAGPPWIESGESVLEAAMVRLLDRRRVGLYSARPQPQDCDKNKEGARACGKRRVHVNAVNFVGVLVQEVEAKQAGGAGY